MSLTNQDVSELNLGPEFENVPCLFNGEVALILNDIKQRAEQEDDEDLRDRVEDQKFMDALLYCERFTKFKSKEAVQSARKVLSDKGLYQFEIATLANLCPETETLAKAYVPSLLLPERNFQSYDLKDIIQNLKLAETYQN